MKILEGDCVEVMRGLPDASVDAIVTDPPYGLGFMGKAWDDLPPGLEWAQECLRVLKPGGHLLAFGGSRTYHRLAVAVEDAGFEIRDQMMWLYGSGFPKSLDVSKAIDKAAGAEREVVATAAGATVVSAATAGAAGAAGAAVASSTAVAVTISVGTAISADTALILGATELTVGVAVGGYVVGRGVSEMVDLVFGDPPQDSAEDACTLRPFVFNMREFDPDYDGTRSYTQRLVLATSADGLQDIVELVISPRTKMDMQTNPNVLRLGASPMEAQLVARLSFH